jgi:hypothetical protein
MPSIQVKRGTRSQLDSAASANQLKVAELYWITDEDRVAIGKSVSAYVDIGKASDFLTISTTAPSSPSSNDKWFDTNVGRYFTYVSGYWVELEGLIPFDGPYVVGHAYGTTVVTLPAHQAGDLILVMAARSNSVPTVASEYTEILFNTSTLYMPYRLAYKIAESSAESGGTWANSAMGLWLVIRGANSSLPIGAKSASLDANLESFTIPGFSLSSVHSLVISFIAINYLSNVEFVGIDDRYSVIDSQYAALSLSAHKNLNPHASKTWSSESGTTPALVGQPFYFQKGSIPVLEIKPQDSLVLPPSPSAGDTFSWGQNSWTYRDSKWFLS